MMFCLINLFIKMKKLIYILSISLLSVIWISCEDDYNNWEIEEGHDRLFKSLLFEVSGIESTAVELKFTQSVSATKYVFEFSEDSLEFLNIVRTVEMVADTLTPFSSSSTITKNEFRETIIDLDGTTGYSVRMKSVDETSGKESNWCELYFETPAEQIFTGYTPTSTSIALSWTVSDRVTNLSLFDINNELVSNFELTDDQKAAGNILIEGLSMGTNYIAQMFNADKVRGTLNVVTSGIADGYLYQILDTDNVETINAALQDLVAGGNTNINVEFAAGQSYDIGGKIIIPTGVNNIAFVGSENASGVKTSLQNAYFTVESAVNNINLQYLSTTSDGNFLIDIDSSDKSAFDIRINGCNVSEINSIVRLRSGGSANSIVVNNCMISETGGWGMLNVGSGSVIGSIDVTNCTLTEISTRFADIRVSTDITFSNITLCNINRSMSHFWRFDNNNPANVTIEDCIFSGPNGGVELNDTYSTYSNITIYYTGSYKTNDLLIKDRPLTGITELPLSMEGLFVDPVNGDFHIQEDAGFAGTGVAGDKRWFN